MIICTLSSAPNFLRCSTTVAVPSTIAISLVPFSQFSADDMHLSGCADSYTDLIPTNPIDPDYNVFPAGDLKVHLFSRLTRKHQH